MQVASLHAYPVKSLRGTTVADAEVEARGLAGDRRLMLVDEDGMFLTQREEPRIARLEVRADAGVLTIVAADLAPLRLVQTGGERRTVTVWGASVDAAQVDEAVDRALSDWLGRRVQLVAMDERSHRGSNPAWAPDAPVSFADGFPILIATTASLDALNRRIVARGGTAVPMARFRPNVVVAGGAAWDEDGWDAVRIGDVVLDLIKPCQRCIVTTTDQLDGSRLDDEPLRTLATFRRSLDRRVAGVLFGWNAVPRGPGTVRAGDPVEVLGTRAAWPVG